MATNALELIGPVPRGRPSSYTEDVAREICERLAAGELLVDICEDADMPTIRTVMNWLGRYEEFYFQYASARERQQHLETEEIRKIADDLSILPEHKRQMIDARKWRAERLAKRFYAPAVKHEHAIESAAPLSAERVPESLAWLVGQLPSGDATSGRGPDHSDVGEE
jgi:hypothetical protein